VGDGNGKWEERMSALFVWAFFTATGLGLL
jgi:hypothetical protein